MESYKKKILYVSLVMMIIFSCFAGCSKAPVNQIAPKELSQQQKDIVDLITVNNQEILFFDCITEDEYKKMVMWVEVYEYGELIDSITGMDTFSDEMKTLNREMAIIINHNPDFKWTFSVKENGARIDCTRETTKIKNSSLGNIYGFTDGPVEIKAAEEIILYASFFSDDGLSVINDLQLYAQQPELYEEYPCAYFIKCKFDK